MTPAQIQAGDKIRFTQDFHQETVRYTGWHQSSYQRVIRVIINPRTYTFVFDGGNTYTTPLGYNNDDIFETL